MYCTWIKYTKFPKNPIFILFCLIYLSHRSTSMVSSCKNRIYKIGTKCDYKL